MSLPKSKSSPAAAPGEFDAIRAIQRILSQQGAPAGQVTLGIGDDAALLKPKGRQLVWTVDVQVEWVHFDHRWVDLESIGWRSFQAAASDLAAMGAHPVAALSSLVLPKGFSGLNELVRGQAQASRALGCPVAGGNLSRGSELSITTTVLGSVSRPLLRSGARSGDELWVVGPVGLAAAGLRLLQAGCLVGRNRAERRCLTAWRRPEARMVEGLALVGRASSAVDISDGLSGESRHLAESSGVRVVVEALALERALTRELRAVAAALDLDPLKVALQGGEDYALLATGPARKRPECAQVIGRIESGKGAVIERGNGRQEPLEAGFDHWAK